MRKTIDWSLTVLNTVISVRYGDLSQWNADVLISSDDIYLSMASGVAGTIAKAAGEGVRAEAHKHTLPQALGGVVVTGGGQLPAKYIFHASTLNYTVTPRAEVLMARIIRRTITLASALHVQSIAMPLFGTGIVGLNKATALEYIIRSIASALLIDGGTVGEVTVLVYPRSEQLTKSSEKQLLQELDDLPKRFATWKKESEHIRENIAKLTVLADDSTDDPIFVAHLDERVAALRNKWREVFWFDAFDDLITMDGDVPLSLAQFTKAKNRLETLITEMGKRADHEKVLFEAETRRLQQREFEEAQTGISTRPEVKTEIEDLRQRLQQRTRTISLLQEQQVMYRQRIDALQAKPSRAPKSPPLRRISQLRRRIKELEASSVHPEESQDASFLQRELRVLRNQLSELETALDNPPEPR